jgi:hypothetical protein
VSLAERWSEDADLVGADLVGQAPAPGRGAP